MLSTEVLTDSGWEIAPTVVPQTMYVSCVVAIDDDSYFAHGGVNTATNFSPQTFIFTGSKNLWTGGPNLAIGRFGNGCGILPKNEKSSQMSIVIVGGYIG